MRHFKEFKTQEDCHKSILSLILSIKKEALNHHSFFTFALSGGSTPHALYDYLSKHNEEDILFCQRTHLFIGDERMVPLDHEWSNYKAITHSLFNKINLPCQNIHHFDFDQYQNDCALHYSKQCLHFFKLNHHEPKLDLTLLGIGTDGHTASLFSNSNYQKRIEFAHLCPKAPIEPQVQRASLSLKTINNSQNVLFLSKQPGKESVIQKLTDNDTDPQIPSSMVNAQKETHFFIIT